MAIMEDLVEAQVDGITVVPVGVVDILVAALDITPVQQLVEVVDPIMVDQINQIRRALEKAMDRSRSRPV
tara:strand:- start:139 stop:348 length:210 start_codon:yes stop_codon:yes gene_type:complete